MKLFNLPLALCLLGLAACSDDGAQSEAQANPQEVAQVVEIADFEKQTFAFDAASMTDGCSINSDMVCAINLFVKCSIDPLREECVNNKAQMPSFVFMQDESLGRPTQVSYQIKRLKPLAGGVVEVSTQSQCNGKWFGLCNGNIIYVMKPMSEGWLVQDVYALGS